MPAFFEIPLHFLLRQFFMGIPRDLMMQPRSTAAVTYDLLADHAALGQAALATVAVFSFLNANDFLGPPLYCPGFYTIAVAGLLNAARCRLAR